QASNRKGIRHRRKNKPLGRFVGCDGRRRRIGRCIEKNVVIATTKALERLQEDILRDEKLILGNQGLIDLFQIATSSNNMDVLWQLDVFIVMGNNDICRLFFANKHFKCSEKALTGNPKMECGSMIHIEIPNQASSSYRTKSSRQVHCVSRLRHASLLI